MSSIQRSPSIIPLWVPVLIGKLIPLYGALFLQWDTFSIFLLYWILHISLRYVLHGTFLVPDIFFL